MAHDRLKHISVFRSGTGQILISNDTLGGINQHTGWLVEHLEMALANYTSTPEQHHEISHVISKVPWKSPEGRPLNILRIRLARVADLASALPAEWFKDYPVTGKEVFVVSATFVAD